MQTRFVEPTSTHPAELDFPRRFNFSTPLLTTPRPEVPAAKTQSHTCAPNGRGLIEALTSSKIFQEYESAFTMATGLPVSLRPVETWQLPHHGKRNEAPWCALMSQKSRACAS